MKRVALAVIGITLAWPACAQWIEEIRGPEPPLEQAAPADSEEIRLDPGFARLVRFDRPLQTVIVGDPTIARVVAQSDRVLSIIGTGVGATNLLVLADNGDEIFSGSLRVSGRVIHRVIIASKPRLHEYWAYFCSATSCHRTKDEFEGEVPAIALPRGNTREMSGPNPPGKPPQVQSPPPAD